MSAEHGVTTLQQQSRLGGGEPRLPRDHREITARSPRDYREISARSARDRPGCSDLIGGAGELYHVADTWQEMAHFIHSELREDRRELGPFADEVIA